MSDSDIEIIEPLFLPDDDSDPEINEISGQLLNETVYRIYREEWDKFFEWKQQSSAYVISSLSQASYSRPTPLHTKPETWRPTNRMEDEVLTWFEIEDINPSTTERTSTRVGVEPFVLGEWEAYPRYSTCTPASRNMLAEDADHIRLPFAPYADDAQFAFDRYLKRFAQFEWQLGMSDPGVESLQLDVARRLHYMNNLSFADIDSLSIFDDTSLREKISNAAKRDELRWPGNQLMDIPKLENKQEHPDTLLDTVVKMNELFCANHNCLMPLCDLHRVLSAPLIHPKPNMTNEAYKNVAGKVCKRECYRSLGEENINKENNHWNDEDRELFKSVITMDPDASPCDLAVICRKPCVEMYVARLSYVKDEDVQAEENEDGHVRFKEIEFAEDRDEKVRAVGPCSHVGPCNQYAIDCPCYINKQRCLRTCRCPVTCKIRYEGCKCPPVKRNGKIVEVCGTNCKCRELRRECDPELCHITRHGPKDQRTRTKKCSNMALQKGEHSSVYVKPSQWGLGAFALRHIRYGTCIGEYVGEIFQEAHDLAVRQIHTGLNYSFDYTTTPDKGEILDSWNYGNETRYLNHTFDFANCLSETVVVCGVQRVKIQAQDDIRKGQELTLDYGPTYWNKDNMHDPRADSPTAGAGNDENS